MSQASRGCIGWLSQSLNMHVNHTMHPFSASCQSTADTDANRHSTQPANVLRIVCTIDLCADIHHSAMILMHGSLGTPLSMNKHPFSCVREQSKAARKRVWQYNQLQSNVPFYWEKGTRKENRGHDNMHIQEITHSYSNENISASADLIQSDMFQMRKGCMRLLLSSLGMHIKRTLYSASF
jgi:hypothetical protein